MLCTKLALKLEFTESELEHRCLRLVISGLYEDINEWNLNLRIYPKPGTASHHELSTLAVKE